MIIIYIQREDSRTYDVTKTNCVPNSSGRFAPRCYNVGVLGRFAPSVLANTRSLNTRSHLDLPSRRTHLQAAVCVRRYSQYVPVGVHQPSVPLVPPLWERPYDVNGGCLWVDLQDAVGALRHAVDAAVCLSGEAAVPLALALEGPSDVRDAVVLGVDDQDPLGLLRDAPYSAWNGWVSLQTDR